MAVDKQCVAVDANTEFDLVSALQVSVFPEIIFTKAGKILYREKGIIPYCITHTIIKANLDFSSFGFQQSEQLMSCPR